MATLEVSNIIKTHKSAVDSRAIATKFTYPNPKFIENERLGFSNFGVPRTISLFKKNADNIFFPRGLLKEVFSLNPRLEIIDHTITNPTRFNPSRIILKPHQIPALDELLKRNQGILEAPPASGKTIVAIETIVRRRQKALVLVHTKDLMEQWIGRFQEFTDIEPGTIQEGEFNIKDVTIGMVQSLNRPLEKTFINQFGLVLLDECHHAPAITFQKLINQFSARYRYGLTATPERQDGLSFILAGVMGRIIHQIRRPDLVMNGEIMEPFIKVIHTNFYLGDIKSYGAMITAMTEDKDRNEYILRVVSEEASDGHFCLALSERIEHVHALQEQYSIMKQAVKSTAITSRISKKRRDAILKSMKEGQIQVLFATKLADEGLDIPRLDRLFLTCPIRSVNKINQQIGRIQRKFPGKKDAVVFDFRDSLVSLAESQYTTRLKQVYHEYDVIEVPYAR